MHRFIQHPSDKPNSRLKGETCSYLEGILLAKTLCNSFSLNIQMLQMKGKDPGFSSIWNVQEIGWFILTSDQSFCNKYNRRIKKQVFHPLLHCRSICVPVCHSVCVLRLLHAGAKTLSINFPRQISVQRAHKYRGTDLRTGAKRKKIKMKHLSLWGQGYNFLFTLTFL